MRLVLQHRNFYGGRGGSHVNTISLPTRIPNRSSIVKRRHSQKGQGESAPGPTFALFKFHTHQMEKDTRPL